MILVGSRGTRRASHQRMQISDEMTARLLARSVLEYVTDCLDSGALMALQEELAVEIARHPDYTDVHILAIPRALIANALRRTADNWERGIRDDDQEPRDRYLNALGNEGEA